MRLKEIYNNLLWSVPTAWSYEWALLCFGCFLDRAIHLRPNLSTAWVRNSVFVVFSAPSWSWRTLLLVKIIFKNGTSPPLRVPLERLVLDMERFWLWQDIVRGFFFCGRHVDMSQRGKAAVRAKFHLAASVSASWCRACWLSDTQ